MASSRSGKISTQEYKQFKATLAFLMEKADGPMDPKRAQRILEQWLSIRAEAGRQQEEKTKHPERRLRSDAGQKDFEQLLKRVKKTAGLRNKSMVQALQIWVSLDFQKCPGRPWDEIESKTRVVSFQAGTLVVEVRDHMLLQELKFHQNAILKQLQLYEDPRVGQLQFRIGSGADPDTDSETKR